MNKKLILFGIVFTFLTISSVMASPATLTWSIQSFADDMSVELYCDGSYLGSRDLPTHSGFIVSSVECEGNLKGDLYVGTTYLESQTVPRSGNEYYFDFCGLTPVPEFTTIGAAIAMVGSAVAYKLKSKKK